MTTTIERIAVRISYTVTRAGKPENGELEFIARVVNSSKGYDLVGRGRRAVSRRLKVPLSTVEITGVLG